MSEQLTLGQRRLAAAQRPAAGAFWTEVLRGASTSTFPADHAAAPRSGAAPVAARLPVAASLVERLVEVSRGRDASLHALVLAGVAVLLHEYTGEADVLVGVPATVNNALARVVPVRQEISGDATFRDLVQGAGAKMQTALAHQDYPIDLVADDVCVVVAIDVAVGDESSEGSAPETGFVVRRDHDGWWLDVYADTARFGATTARRLGRQLLLLITRALARPTDKVCELDLRDDDDIALVERVNATSVDFPGDATLPQLFARCVTSNRDAVAVMAGDRTLTFAEFDAASTTLAHRLRERGVARDVVVAVMADRSVEMLAALHGVLKAGGAYLPLDPTLPEARIDFMLRDSGAVLVLVQPSLAGRLPAVVPTLPLTDELLRPVADAASLPIGTPTDAAYVIYTSGSTGQPKGVVVEHRSVVNRLHWMQRAYPIGPGDVILQKTSISFDVSVWELFWWSIAGGAVCLLEPGGERNPAAIVDAIERYGVTTMHFVPSMLGAFLDYVETTGESGRLANLRRVFASGEALTPHHVGRFSKQTSGVELVNLYGPTEATVDVTHHVCDPADAIVPIGTPIDNVRVYVLDDHGRQRPVGMPGELWLAGVGLARGYLDREELTAERFAVRVIEGEDRAYRTGDLVRWMPDGAIEFLGRTDFQVKVRGYRIELGEIEERLTEHLAVAEAAVVARAGADGQPHLIGYVRLGGMAQEEELRSHVAAAVPSWMVPERIVVLDDFPRTSSGKLDRKALPEPAADGAREHVAPRTERERLLAGIWCEVLGLDAVSVNDSFFALGGNSIHFVAVLARARTQGFDLTFQQLFQHPTIAELAQITTDNGAGAPHEYAAFELVSDDDRARMPIAVEDAYPLSMLQAGLVYESEKTRGNRAYHDIISYLIRSSIDLDLFREAVRILVAQNPIFRTSYHLDGFSEYLQLVHEQISDLPLSVADLRYLSDDEQDDWYETWFTEEQNRPFDWTRPGLVRLHVHVLRDDLYRYSISQHNSALDGWSINQVHVKLFEIYFALRDNGQYAGESVQNHLRNFVGLEIESINSPEHQAFWSDMLADRPSPQLPRLRARDDSKDQEVVFHDVALPNGLSDRLVALAQRLGVPVKDVLLASHVKVMTLLHGRDDIVTGYEHAGRPELPDAEKAMGVFLNTMPVRVRVAPGSWNDLIRQVYDAEAQLLPYRRYAMAKVKQDLRTQETLMESVFNFTHFYSLKRLRELPEFALLDVRAAAITEFPFRTEYSQHFYTDEVQLSLHYHTAVFDPDHIARVGSYFVAVLEAMVQEPSAAHHDSDLLPASETAALAGFASRAEVAGRGKGDVLAVLDAHGRVTPIGTLGDVVAKTSSGDHRVLGRGRWLADGTLELEGPDRASEAAELPSVAANAGVTSTPAVEFSQAARTVATIWGEVLGVDATSIGMDDDFFELGGNSMAAMRTVMRLDGAVSLKDVLRCSVLAELAAVVERAALAVDQTLLVPLTERFADTVATVVCIPYAGGNAVHFRPVAEAMSRRLPGVAVAAVELPGHAPDASADGLRPLAETADLIATEIQQDTRGPVVLWGHCVGSALAIEVARLLEERGRPVRHLFLAAKLLVDAADIEATVEQAAKLTFDDIREWLAEWTGSSGLDELGADYEELLVRTFRHDSAEANAFLLAARRNGVPQALRTPCTVVMAADDPVTQGYADKFRAWELFVAAPRLHAIPTGGHYFTRTRADDVADLIADVVGAWAGGVRA